MCVIAANICANQLLKEDFIYSFFVMVMENIVSKKHSIFVIVVVMEIQK